MANITEILGTDSLSSSRITINGNFSSLNNEMADVTTLLDTTTSIITNLAGVETEAITVQNGGTLIVEANANVLQIGVSSQFDKEITLGGRLIKNGISGTAASPINPSTTPIDPLTGEFTTYIVNANATIPAGIEGQELTLVNEAGGPINITGSGGILGAQTLTLDNTNSTVTLRHTGSKWYIISHVGATIVL